jgi:hypothetical protein
MRMPWGMARMAGRVCLHAWHPPLTPTPVNTRAQYNYCRWKGGVLRVEVARPDYALRLQREWAEDAEAEAAEAEEAATTEGAPEGALEQDTTTTSGAEAAAGDGAADEWYVAPPDPLRPFYLPMPGRKRRVSPASTQPYIFLTHAHAHAHALRWSREFECSDPPASRIRPEGLPLRNPSRGSLSVFVLSLLSVLRGLRRTPPAPACLAHHRPLTALAPVCCCACACACAPPPLPSPPLPSQVSSTRSCPTR